MKNTQEIRESQFVLVYGPGSIIESKEGSRLIPNIYHCLGNDDYSGNTFKDNEYNDMRMKSVIAEMKGLNKEAIHLFPLPLYSSRRQSSSRVIYNSYIFPAWKICHESDHDGLGSILYNASKPGKGRKINTCPVCGKKSDTNVRFLLACIDGHLDDIDWNYTVHGYHKKCKYNWFIWKPEGSSPEEIKIQCPDPNCKKEVNMLQIYGMDFDCRGRLPENQMPTTLFGNVSFPDEKDDVYQDCDKRMFVVQRQSSSLRVANSFTLLRMPRSHDYVIKILMKPNYQYAQDIIEDGGGLDKLLKFVRRYSLNDYKKIYNYFNKKNKDFNSFKKSFLNSNNESNFKDAFIDEFELLMDEEIIFNDANFEKGKFKEDYSLKLFDKKFPIKIRPISKLKTITAQISYHRKPQVPTDKYGRLLNKPVCSAYSSGDEYWFPAFEGVGEGIFISSDENPIDFLGIEKISKKWDKYIHKIDTGNREEIKKPLFVWWHTLSHALINSLAISCGYNATSLKERVYINDSNAGILIYNTSPGEDSGMGGLIDLVDSFEIVLENAINNLKFCSNDPLCFEEGISDNKVNGAACHNCLLISETSCEHRNTLLDRHFFVD